MLCLQLILLVLACVYAQVHASIVPDAEKIPLLKPTTQHSEAEVNLTKSNNRVEFERKVYLEDVFYSLKSQTWDDEEQLCLNQTLDLLTNLQNFTLWAASMWDSMASQPRGMLYGTKYQLGNFDECLKPTWIAEEHPHLITQYCLAEVKLLQAPRNVPKYKIHFSPYQSALDKIYYTGDPSRRPLDTLTWGTCVPASCSPRSVERLLTALLLRSSLAVAGLQFNITVDSTCQRDTSQDQYDGEAIAFISVCIMLSAVVVISTTVHWYTRTFSNDNQNEEAAPRVVQAFSLLKNLPSLAKKNESGLDVLYGIRYISICFIVTSHRFAVFSGSALSNGWESDQIYQNPLSILLVHDDLLVDTFFFMSGLLVTKSLLSVDRFPNILVLIFKRYMRLIPGLAMLLFYMCTVYPSAGSGPLWLRSVEYDVGPCRKNWWVNMLMLTNYVRLENMCIPTTWYIPADFHFFLLATWLCYTMRRSKHRAYWLGTVLAMVAVLAPGIITAYYRLPAILLFFNSFVLDPRGDETFQRVYIPSHTRAAAYLVGVAAGYTLTKLYPLKDTKKLSMLMSTLGACAGMLVMVIVMATGSVFYEAGREYGAVEAATYAALNRPAWAIGIAAVVMCCAYGTVPLVTSVLSWSPWVPLSKLAYGVYLTHMSVIARDVHVARDPRLYDILVLIHRTTGDIVWATVAALLLWLAVEAPIGNLLAILLAPRRHRSSVAPAHGVSQEQAVTRDPESLPPDPQSSRSSQMPSPQPGDILRSKC